MRDEREQAKHDARQSAEIRMLRRELEASRAYAERLERELLEMTEAALQETAALG